MDKGKQSNARLADVITALENFPLIEALKMNDLSSIQELDKDDAGILTLPLNSDQMKAIHLACEYGSFDIVVFILTKCPDQVNERDSFGQTPIFCAASNGHDKIVQYLVDRHAVLNGTVDNPFNVNERSTAIINAMMNGHHRVVNILLRARALTKAELVLPEAFRIALRWGVEQNNLLLVQSLLTRASFSVMDIKEQVNMMSIAVQGSSLAIIQLFVDYNSRLLVLAADHEQPPVFWAVCRGEVGIVQLFINARINLNTVVEWPGHADNGKLLYILANERKHYAVASLIISSLLNEQNQQTIFDFIIDHDTALAYSLLSPINAKLILNNPRLIHLMKKSGVNVSSSAIGYYKTTHARRPSFFAEIDRITGEADVFESKALLGEGANGVARYFVNAQNNRHLVIKSPKEDWFNRVFFKDVAGRAVREMGFVKQAFYADETASSHVFCIKRYNFFGKDEFTLRSVIPYAGPVSVAKVFSHIHQANTLAEIILSMTESLMNLHKKGIIHGDIKEDNVVLSSDNNKQKATFIDFEFSYCLTDAEATFDYTGAHWAPERRLCLTPPAPDTSQDVYSYADMLRRIILSHPQKVELDVSFPSIIAFICKALDLNPGNRPTLESFYVDLSVQLAPYKQVESTLSEYEQGIFDMIDP